MPWLPDPKSPMASLACAGHDTMKRLSGLRLRVKDPASLIGFYTDVLGMQARHDGVDWRLGYPGRDADLVLSAGGADYVHVRSDRYWKIGICLPDLDLACAQLQASGVAVSQPRQFLDIGYMAHLNDPAGFAIELLQHDFQGQGTRGEANLPLGGGAHIGQITLRTGDISAEIAQFSDMKLLSVQEVSGRDFDLHFLAYTEEEPPNPDLRAVENRPWLWKRPYTMLEFQHIAGAEFSEVPAFQGLEIS